MGNNANAPKVRFDGFSEPWLEHTFNDVVSVAERPFEMSDDKRYQCVTAKRRNGGIVSRGFFKGSDILVKSQFKIKAGDYLISKRQVVHGANGVVPAVLDDAIVSNEYLVFQESELLNMDFLAILSKLPFMYEAFFLSSNGVHIEKLLFDFEDWLTRTVCIPTKDEQKAIVGFFHNLDNAIALKKQEHEQTANIKKAMLEKMFPKNGADVPEIRFDGFNELYEVKKLGDISDSFSGGTPSVGNASYYDGNIPFIRSAEINSTKTELFISEEGLANSSAKTVYVGDVLYALYGATSGEVGISCITGAINQAILCIKPHKGYDSYYIAQWLRANKLKIVSYYLQGGQGNLSGSIVKGVEIPLPSIEEQTAIGNFFRNLDTLLEAQREELVKLQNIKKACLSKMFVSGEVANV